MTLLVTLLASEKCGGLDQAIADGINGPEAAVMIAVLALVAFVAWLMLS